jgi:hypothetical protein
VGTGVLSSTCQDFKCVIQCAAGYSLCNDNTCVPQGQGCQLPPLPGCETFQENQCVGNTIITNASFENHRWYTPDRGTDGWQPSYQDFSKLVGYAEVQYQPGMQAALVTIVTITKDPSVTVSVYFDGVLAPANTQKFDSTYTKTLEINCKGSDGSVLQLEPTDFVWNVPAINHSSGDYRNGQKGGIVEMFGWPHADVEKECSFLAAAGYLGVKVYPIQEQVMSGQPFDNIMNPWSVMRIRRKCLFGVTVLTFVCCLIVSTGILCTNQCRIPWRAAWAAVPRCAR